jgi:hypothetical protein
MSVDAVNYLILPLEFDSVTEVLTLQARQKTVGVEGVQDLQLCALREQLCKLVGSLLHLPNDRAPDNSWPPDDDCELVILGPNSVVDINKVAKHLTTKQTASRTRLGIRPGNQTDVEARPVGAIDDRGFPTEPEEKLPTVCTLIGVSMQGNTPVAAPVFAGAQHRDPRMANGKKVLPASVVSQIESRVTKKYGTLFSETELAPIKSAGESVSRILSAAEPSPDLHRSELVARRGDHSSRSRIAPGLKQPTRGSQSSALFERSSYGPGQPSPPIWPCSTRGFPCPGCRHPSGGLLPHLFTLAKAPSTETGEPQILPGACRRGVGGAWRYIFCGTFRSRIPKVCFRPPLSATPWRYQARCPSVAGSCELTTNGVRTFLPSASPAKEADR